MKITNKKIIITLVIFSHVATYAHPTHALILPVTEQNNPHSRDIDAQSALGIVQIINAQDCSVAQAITPWLNVIAQAVDAITASLQCNGRLVYVGAGTSGRLGVLDASECIPTFSAPEGQIVGIIAGGDGALRRPVENAEDNRDAGVDDLKNINISSNDIVCGISASGGAPYVHGALTYARSIGCSTIFVTCNPACSFKNNVDFFIAPETGPEVIAGSTRLKAGTATKMVLNMLTTGTFIRYGKVYKNMMVDMMLTNQKLVGRANRMLQEILGVDHVTAQELLNKSKNNIKRAILIHLLGIDCDIADQMLHERHGAVREVLNKE